MLHAVKKKVALVATNTNAPAEFLDYKHRLESVKKNISHALTRMDDCNRHWMKGVADQRSFSDTFVHGYPNSQDETHAVAVKFAQEARDRHDHFARYNTPEQARYNRMIQQIRGYVDEIDSVEAMYPSLLEAKSEADRYQSKLDSMEHKRVSDEKVSRNIIKHDNEHDRYVALASEVVEAQKQAYAKATIVHKMMLLAYWQANMHHVGIVNKSLEGTADWVHSSEEEMLSMDLAHINVESPPTYRTASHVHAATPVTPTGLMPGNNAVRDTGYVTSPTTVETGNISHGHTSTAFDMGSHHSPLNKTEQHCSPLDRSEHHHTPLDKAAHHNSPLDRTDHHRLPLDRNEHHHSPLEKSRHYTPFETSKHHSHRLPDNASPVVGVDERASSAGEGNRLDHSRLLHGIPLAERSHDHVSPVGHHGKTEVETIQTATGTTVIEKTRLPAAPGSSEADVIIKATATERVRVPAD